MAVLFAIMQDRASAEGFAASEEISGAIVMVNDYCNRVASGELFATDPVLLAQGDEARASVEADAVSGADESADTDNSDGLDAESGMVPAEMDMVGRRSAPQLKIM